MQHCIQRVRLAAGHVVQWQGAMHCGEHTQIKICVSGSKSYCALHVQPLYTCA